MLSRRARERVRRLPRPRAAGARPGRGVLRPNRAAPLSHALPEDGDEGASPARRGHWRAAGRWRDGDPALEEAAAASYRELAAPGLEAVARVGNTYTASLYLCLAALLEAEGRALAAKRLGLFSYGSGCCAEFFAGTIPERVDRVADAGVAAVLAARTFIDVDAYERLRRAGESAGEPPADFSGEFVFAGIRDERRVYGRPGALAA